MSTVPRRLLRAAVTSIVAAVTALATSAAVPAHAAPARPFVVGGQTVPVYSYADAIRESVWVETPTDADGDGVRDRVAVDLVRPREAAAAGIKVPVIMDASPYYACCGRGNESELKEYDANGVITKEPLFYDNYFVPRGYAFAGVDLSGTNRSTGCEDVGGPNEVAGAKAAVDWLNGRAHGFAADGSEVTATSWTTGRVGMIGKSWDGSIANGVAATGVKGLATIVPISAISSWYDYTRFTGVLRATGYASFLHSFVNGRPEAACAAVLAGLNSGSSDETGDFNAFWAARDYRPKAGRVHASVFAVHGVNDLNVTTNQFARWWGDLARNGVSRKLWLHQAGHEDPFDVRRGAWVDTLHRWFDFWLQGLHNGVTAEPRVSLETAPGQWTEQRDWPAPGTRQLNARLGAGDGTTGTIGPRRAAAGTLRAYTDAALTEDQQVDAPNTAVDGRLAFLSGPLAAPLRISGSPSVTLRIRVDRPTTRLTARLVDYGTATRIDYLNSEGVRTLTTQSCWGESTAADDACYFDTAENLVTADHAVLTRGWLDTAHHLTLRRSTPLMPGRWYTVTVPLDAYDTVIPAGHALGLVLGQSDPDFTEVTNSGATIDVNLSASTLRLPVVGRATLPDTTTPPALRTATITPTLRKAPAHTRQIP